MKISVATQRKFCRKNAIWLSLHELQKNSGVIVRMCALYIHLTSWVFFFKSAVDDQENQTEHLYFANKGIGSLIR